MSWGSRFERVCARGLAMAACALLGATGAAIPARAGSGPDQVAQAKAQQQALLQVQAQLGSSLAGALGAQQQILQSLQANAAEQHQVSAKVEAAVEKIARLDAQLKALDVEVKATEDRVARERRQLAELARAIYVEPGSLLLLVAEAANLGDLVTRMMDLRSAAARATALKARLDADLAFLGRQRSLRVRDRAEADRQRAALAAALERLRALQLQQEDSSAQLASKIAQTRTELSAVKDQTAELAQRVADLLQAQQDGIIAGAMQQVWDQVQLWQQANPAAAVKRSARHSTVYRFIWPEPGAIITQPFGPSSLGLEPPFGGYPHFHTGIDLAAPAGTPVLAADDGVVVLAGGSQFGYGNYVVVAHGGGLVTLYGHLQQSLVKAGQAVSQGQPIGLEGATGNATGPHCHFELRIGGQPVDPAPYLPPGAPSAGPS